MMKKSDKNAESTKSATMLVLLVAKMYNMWKPEHINHAIKQNIRNQRQKQPAKCTYIGLYM